MSNPFDRFDGIAVINLDTDLYKWRMFRRQAVKYGFADRLVRVPGVRAVPASYGCALAHKHCMDLAREKGWSSILIFEDDAKFIYDQEYVMDSLTRALEGAGKWDLLYLGSSMRENIFPVAAAKTAGDTVRSPGKWFGRFAYAVNESCYDIYDGLPDISVFTTQDRGDVLLERSRHLKKVMMWPQLVSVYNTPSENDPFIQDCDQFIEKRYTQFGMVDESSVKWGGGTDFDFAVVMSSYNRYSDAVRVINQIRGQQTVGTYRIFLLDDGSTEPGYADLQNTEDMTVLRNTHNNGRKGYWKSVGRIMHATEEYNYRYLVQIDDDFVLCTHFLDTLRHMFEAQKCDAVHYHINTEEFGVDRFRWGMECWVDGGTAFTREFLSSIRFRIDPVPESRWDEDPLLSSGVWQQISGKLRVSGACVFKPETTLAVHTGNRVSMMNPDERIKTKIKSRY
ncbi:MAG: glycosyltransferase [Dehalococcoidales bacterium]|jgi:hypothetical protein|nr:glycosyltransferase [Dehalococcoidales bacterium]